MIYYAYQDIRSFESSWKSGRRRRTGLADISGACFLRLFSLIVAFGRRSLRLQVGCPRLRMRPVGLAALTHYRIAIRCALTRIYIGFLDCRDRVFNSVLAASGGWGVRSVVL